ncbi:hypothetical protein [Raoultella terrigena]|uniref:hypothetical protein n=1 Tax=Raoultella terrigena TaxID=577 RepID=UPI0030E32874
MQHHLCFTSWQRPFDYRQKIFPTKQCWRIVAALAGLFLLAISPYTRADQSSAAVAQSTAEGDAGNKPLRKLSPKQFYVEVEIPGNYNISILFDTGLSTNKSSKDYQPEIKKFMEREREVFTLFKKEVEGEINIYSVGDDKFVHKIKIPTENDYFSGDETAYLIDRAEAGQYYASFWLNSCAE